jgi:hypothetical protein
MKRVIIYLIAGITALFLVLVAHYSLKEVIYNLGSADPKPVGSNISKQLDSYVSVKSPVANTGVAHVGHEGIDMYFYPISGYGKRVFAVTDGNILPLDIISGKTAAAGQLKELRRIPFASSAYKDLGIKPGVEYYAIRVGKALNPRLIYTYAVCLLIGGLFFIPILIELKKARHIKTMVTAEACA